MSLDQIHEMAQNDTPSVVEVPKSMSGIAMWVVGRFGGGGVIGLICLLGLHTLYDDSKARDERQNEERSKMNAALLTVIQENARVNSQTATAIDGLRVEIRDAHNRATYQAK